MGDETIVFKMNQIIENQTFRQFALLVGLVVLFYATWGTKIAYPFEVITTFLHELSHAFAFVMTGGSVLEFNVHANTSGTVPGYGGSLFFIFSSGYVGSCLFGSLIFLLAARTDWDRWILAFFGVGVLALTINFSGNSFSLFFSFGTAVVAVLLARFAPNYICDYLLRFIGLSSMLYPVNDVYRTVILNSHLRTDAVMLAESVGGSSVMWGVLWMIISIIIIGLTLRFSFRREKIEKGVSDN